MTPLAVRELRRKSALCFLRHRKLGKSGGALLISRDPEVSSEGSPDAGKPAGLLVVLRPSAGLTIFRL